MTALNTKASIRFIGFLTLLSFTVVTAKPLVIYIGDSIVEKKDSNGYAHVSCAALADVAECYIERSCYRDASGAPIDCGAGYGVDKSIAGFDQYVIRKAPAVVHFNPGINTINCLTPGSVKAKSIFGYYTHGMRTMVGMFRNALPQYTFVYGASTECDACVNNPICDPCGRMNANIIGLNDAARAICAMLEVPYDDLYAASAGQKRTDGRHFDAAGSLKIGKAAADFVRPYIAPAGLRVYPTAPLFDTLIAKGQNLRIAATVDGGSASKVEFYDGETLLGSDETAPYEYTWQSPPAGHHEVKIRAVTGQDHVWSTPVPFDVKPDGFPLKIDCGGYGHGEFIGDRLYTQACGYGGRPPVTSESCVKTRLSVAMNTGIAGTELDQVFRTALFANGCNSSNYFQYFIDVPNGTYHVAILRAEHKEWFDGENGGQTLQHTWVNGTKVETDYDIVGKEGYGKAVVKQYETKVTDGRITLQFYGKGRQVALAGLVIDTRPVNVNEPQKKADRMGSFVNSSAFSIVVESDVVKVSLPAGRQTGRVTLCNALGVPVISVSSNAEQTVELSTRGVAKGVYFVRADQSGDHGAFVGRVVLK